VVLGGDLNLALFLPFNIVFFLSISFFSLSSLGTFHLDENGRSTCAEMDLSAYFSVPFSPLSFSFFLPPFFLSFFFL
jgi:hypothetical protein